jgi:hypothetical protein
VWSTTPAMNLSPSSSRIQARCLASWALTELLAPGGDGAPGASRLPGHAPAGEDLHDPVDGGPGELLVDLRFRGIDLLPVVVLAVPDALGCVGGEPQTGRLPPLAELLVRDVPRRDGEERQAADRHR